jgi:hypothetical protein
LPRTERIVSAARVGARPGLWGGLFAASAAVVIALRVTDAIDSTAGFILFAGVMGLLIPFVRGMAKRRRDAACSSPAAIRYTRRMLIASAGYMLGLGLAITLDRRMELAGATGFLIALLPVLPIFAMIWTMGRYLLEEQDEYLRHRAVIASLAGLGLVLALGSFWGFLETFGMAPHVPGWWAVPVWALGMGLAQAWMALRDRAGEAE